MLSDVLKILKQIVRISSFDCVLDLLIRVQGVTLDEISELNWVLIEVFVFWAFWTSSRAALTLQLQKSSLFVSLIDTVLGLLGRNRAKIKT